MVVSSLSNIVKPTPFSWRSLVCLCLYHFDEEEEEKKIYKQGRSSAIGAKMGRGGQGRHGEGWGAEGMGGVKSGGMRRDGRGEEGRGGE